MNWTLTIDIKQEHLYYDNDLDLRTNASSCPVSRAAKAVTTKPVTTLADGAPYVGAVTTYFGGEDAPYSKYVKWKLPYDLNRAVLRWDHGYSDIQPGIYELELL